MAEEQGVTLHGVWASSFCRRVELAHKIKGIPCKHVEEDLLNKSSLLLQYNPVYKKVPVLVHNGKPLAESLVILEYIDETWKHIGPPLLPADPFERAQVRFWMNFFQQQLFEETLFFATITDGETQANYIQELFEKLKLLEEGMKDYFPYGTAPSVDGESLGCLDILVCSTFGAYRVQEEIIGTKIIDPDKYPLVFCWVTALNEIPVMKELNPPHEKLLALLLSVRNHNLKSRAV